MGADSLNAGNLDSRQPGGDLKGGGAPYGVCVGDIASCDSAVNYLACDFLYSRLRRSWAACAANLRWCRCSAGY